jgi:chromosome partitioning protein
MLPMVGSPARHITTSRRASLAAEQRIRERVRTLGAARIDACAGDRFGHPVSGTVAFANQKGGVGKTTTVVNLAAELALSGRRVLVVDVDPQGNATSALGVERRSIPRSVYDGLLGLARLDGLVVRTGLGGLDLLPSSLSLAGAEVELVPLDRREYRLADLLAGSGQRYAHVLIDCPPSLGLLTVNALTAAAEVIIPLQCEYFGLEGLSQLLAAIGLVRENLNPGLEVGGVVLTMVDRRTRLCRLVEEEVRRHLDGRLYDVAVPRNVRLSEAPSHGLPIARYSPGSRGAEAYRELTAEFLARSGARPGMPPAGIPSRGLPGSGVAA